MIYFFHGTDVNGARKKAFQWVTAAREKAPDAAYIRISAEDMTEEGLNEALGSQGLFFSKSLVLLDDPFSLSASGEVVLSSLKKLQETENAVAILAPKLLTARVKKIEAVAMKVFVVDAKEKKVSRGFNSALVNALGAKDGPELWKEITKSLRAGDAPEMIHGLLHWKARDLMQKGSRTWTNTEARKLSLELIELLSDEKRGELPLQMQLERFALSLKR